MRWTSISAICKAYVTAKYDWHSWYAWYPVRFTNHATHPDHRNQTAWLERIERQKKEVGHRRHRTVWEYRPAEVEAQ